MKDKNENDKEPWNQTFDDVTDDEGNLSRTKLRKQNKSNSLISIILISAIILIAAIALLFGVMKSTSGTGNGDSSSVASTKVQSISTSKEKSAKKDSTSKKHSSAASSKSASAKSSSESSSMAKKSSESSKKESSSASSESGDYVTVQAGQGLYRVATNAGISEQQLLQLNGLTSASQIHPGQKLRVK
ncbi:SAG1386/EF1546 family surface-associated protein [Lactobacillus sp. Sy-1]|uniref:SAG1386/EF1546 family surface-associated protein n=1 Tax=Lactobacillus sp. Sy-1 TaxID=2109645 RepID=UPI001C59E74C|nr:SAG1386/EF1546 family surface-associated protein [Lactobacillus sp. Sy-1]MBW1605547.1 LysM peptidoglycan-binding domain-containing protein [Lactobacillus sp. Sy-1]